MSAAPPGLSVDFEELVAAARRALLEPFPPEGLAWLALVPAWTVPLAQACNFPAGPQPLLAFVERGVAQGLAKEWDTVTPGGETVLAFAAPDLRRPEILEYLRTRQPSGWLLAEAGRAAEALQRADRGGSALVSSGLRAWAELAETLRARGRRRPGGDPAQPAQMLWNQVRDLVNAGEEAVALDWIFAGEALVPLLGAPMGAAVARSQRYVDRRYRRAIDQRHLKDFRKRPEQDLEIRRLLLGPKSEWALHLIGMGGVGKTMLVRSLSGRLAGPRPQAGDDLLEDVPPHIVARIDFDHISPEFPLSRPGQLLVELSVELAALFTDEEHEKHYERFLDDVERLHEVSGRPALGADPLAALDTEAAQAAIRSFAKLLASFGTPVLLILDTCEELAKLHMAGVRLPALEATFEMLERLHAEVDSVRVLFAGRRLLAEGGVEWRADPATCPPYVHDLDHRDYLRLCEGRGFDDGEAAAYLTDNRHLVVAPDVLRRILALAPEAGRVPGISHGPDEDEPARHNPFDVKLLGDWLADHPDPDPDLVGPGVLDAYVASRIVDRLPPDLVDAIPAVALLRRFDEQLLSIAGVPVADHQGQSTMAKLLEQEWIEIEREDADRRRYLEVSPSLWPRLQRFVASPELGPGTDVLRRRLRAGLMAALESDPVTAVSYEAIEACLRLNGLDEAGQAWARIEERVANAPKDMAAAAWVWVRAVAERLAGEAQDLDGAATSPLWAAVSATLASAISTMEPTADLGHQWESVLVGAAAHPDPDIRETLGQRARLGVLRAEARREPPVRSPEPMDALHLVMSRDVDGRVLGGTFGALEALIEAPGQPDPDLETVGRWAEALEAALDDDPLSAWGRCLYARLLARVGRLDDALDGFSAAEGRALRAAPTSTVGLLDWSAPGSVLYRIRLERLRLEWLAGRTPDTERVGRQMADAATQPGDDARCFLALAGLVLLDHGKARDALVALAGVDRASGWVPRCRLHLVVPPYAEIVARSLLALGAADEALVAIRSALAGLGRDRSADKRIQRLRLVELEVVRRLRDASSISASSQARSSENAPLLEAGWATAALTEPYRTAVRGTSRRPEDLPDAVLHARFRSLPQPLLGENAGICAEVVRRATGPASDAGVERVHLEVDALEVHRLGLSSVSFPPDRPRVALYLLRAAAVAGTAAPGAEFQWLGLWLRLSAIEGRDVSKDTEWPLGPVPLHRCGRASLDEGEMLALRWPERARLLFELAYQCGQRTGDAGMVLAAAVGLAAAAAHDGAGVVAQAQARDRARPAWEQLSETVAGLAPWTGLDAPVEERERSSPPGSAAWSGWDVRLRALFGHGRRDEGPPELDLRTWDPTPPPRAAPVVSAIPARDTRGLLTGVLLAVPTALYVLALAVRAGIRAVGWSDPGLWFDALIVIGLIIVVLVLPAVYGPRVSRRLTRPFRDWLRAEMRILALEAEKATIALVVAPRRGWRRAVLGPFWRLGRLFVPALQQGWVLRLERTVALSPHAPVDMARFARRATQPARLATALRADVDVARPWELLLALGFADGKHRTAVFRSVLVPAGEPQAWPGAVHANVVGPLWQPFADEVWAGRSRANVGTPDDRVDAPPPVRVVHVIGTPLLTSKGFALRVGGGRSSQVSESFSTSQYSPSNTASTWSVPDYLEPTHPILSTATIVVLQVDPGGSAIVSDPGQAGGLRQFAQQVVLACGRPVICVPTLPPGVASDGMRTIARAAGRHGGPPSVERLLDWVDGLRRVVIGDRGDTDGLMERVAAAYDVALLWPDTTISKGSP